MLFRSRAGCPVRGPTGVAIRTGQPALCRDIPNDPQFIPWREAAIISGYSSSLVVPLFGDDETIGAINIYSEQPDAFSDEEVNLLAKLAGDLSAGLKTIRLNLEVKRAKEDLEIKVAHRTSQLMTTMTKLEEEKQKVLDVLNMIPAFVSLISPE